MKIDCIIAFALTIVFFQDAKAQAKKYPIPEYANTASFYRASKNDLIKLEKQKVYNEVKVKDFGFGGGDALISVPEDDSKKRFDVTDTLTFFIRLNKEFSEYDPADFISVIKFTRGNQKRSFTQASGGGFLQTGQADINKAGYIPYEIKKIDDSVYLIKLKFTAQPGEYAILIETGIVQMPTLAYCFGLD